MILGGVWPPSSSHLFATPTPAESLDFSDMARRMYVSLHLVLCQLCEIWEHFELKCQIRHKPCMHPYVCEWNAEDHTITVCRCPLSGLPAQSKSMTSNSFTANKALCFTLFHSYTRLHSSFCNERVLVVGI